MNQQRPSLRVFERQVAERQLQDALQTVLQILQAIDDRFGRLERVDFSEIPAELGEDEVALVFATRFAGAFGRLLVDPALTFTPIDYERLLIHHRWIDLIFSISGFRSSDHLLPLLATGGGPRQMTFEGTNFLRLLAMLTLNSRIGIDLDEFWKANRVGAALGFLQYISSRYVFQPRAFAFRERLLEWLPDKLDDVKLGSLTLSRLPEIYMHCSYAISPKKHAIKASLMKQMHRACIEAGIAEVPAGGPSPSKDGKPTAVVICEHFIVGHSMHRTHSLAVKSLREKFHLVGVLYRHQVSPAIGELFDEIFPFPEGDFMDSVRKVAAEVTRRNAAFVLFPSVGMTPHAIALASVRMAPIQFASYGHAASTMSPAIDYMVLPEDFAGSPERFSEKLLALPRRHMPFTPRQLTRAVTKQPFDRKADGKVRVGIPASTMKLNPRYFDALARVAAQARTPMEFQFFPLASTGLPHIELTRVLRHRLPSATVFPEAPHDDYLERLSRCDFFLCPFPYGNTNSIVDSILVGLPGICLDGPEPHEHIDAGLFARLGLPAELVTKSVDEYVTAAVKMIDDEAWRLKCREISWNCDIDDAFFRGDATQFCKAISNVIWPPAAKGRKAQLAKAE